MRRAASRSSRSDVPDRTEVILGRDFADRDQLDAVFFPTGCIHEQVAEVARATQESRRIDGARSSPADVKSYAKLRHGEMPINQCSGQRLRGAPDVSFDLRLQD